MLVFCNLRVAHVGRVLWQRPIPQSAQIIQMMNSLARIPSWMALHWRSGAVVAGLVGIAATCRWCLETDQVRDQRAQRRNKKELRALADRISLRAQCPSAVPNRGRSRLRARFGGTTAQAPRFCCHSTRPSFGRTKSPKGSPERVLEAQRLISVVVSLGDPMTCSHRRSWGYQQNVRRQRSGKLIWGGQ